MPWPCGSVAGPTLTKLFFAGRSPSDPRDRAADQEADRRTRDHVAQVVAVLLDAGEPDAGGERVHRDADLPPVVVVRHAGEAERGGGVARGERERVAAVRPIALHGVLEQPGVGAVHDHRLREVVAHRTELPLRREAAGHEERTHHRQDRGAAQASRPSCRRSGSFPGARPSSDGRTPRRASWPRRRRRRAAGSGPRTCRRRSCRGSSGRRRACGGPRAGCRRARACRSSSRARGPSAGPGSGRGRGRSRTPTPAPTSRRPSPRAFSTKTSWRRARRLARYDSGEYGMTLLGRAARESQGPSRVVKP